MIKKFKNKGFTLTELLVVVFLIGILTAFAVPRYLTNLETAKVSEATDYLRQWQSARALIYAETQHYTPAHRMDYLAFDSTIIQTDENGWTSTFRNFCCFSSTYQMADSNNDTQTLAAAFCRNKASGDETCQQVPNLVYYIYATETRMYCCWDGNNQHSKARKVCESISSGVLAENDPAVTSNQTFAAMSCYIMNDD